MAIPPFGFLNDSTEPSYHGGGLDAHYRSVIEARAPSPPRRTGEKSGLTSGNREPLVVRRIAFPLDGFVERSACVLELAFLQLMLPNDDDLPSRGFKALRAF